MQNSQSKIPFSTKLGFITGPLLITLGLYLFQKGDKLGYALIAFGIVRLILTTWLFLKRPNK